MAVYVCGTGCQIFVENDHKLGCAASVEHTPHPLGRPSSYCYPFPADTMAAAVTLLAAADGSLSMLILFCRHPLCCR